MIIIYNASGFLVALAGLALGFVAALLTGSLALGLVLVALTWIGLGILWRRQKTATGAKHSWPSVFFIPLPLWAILPALLVPVVFIGERFASVRQSDPRFVELRQDESDLRSGAIDGNKTLEHAVLLKITAQAYGGALLGDARARVQTSNRGVLVLVRAPNLKTVPEQARRQLLDDIEATVRAERDFAQANIYIGVKGKIAHGAVRSPKETRIGEAVPSDALLQFYGDAAPPASGNGTPAVPRNR